MSSDNPFTKVEYPRTVSALLRNGYIKQGGIGIYKDVNDDIKLYALTSKGDIATGNMRIPKEQLKEFIERLQERLNESN
jgi:hypothetical protein